MIVRTGHFSRLVVYLVGIIASLLVRYKIDGAVKLQADGSMEINLTSEGSDGTMTKIEQTCEDFRVMFLGRTKSVRNPKIEDITSPGRHTARRVTSNEPLAGDLGFIKSKGTYFFTLPSLHKNTSVFNKFRVRIAVVMPRKVAKASDGEISESKVIVDSFDFASWGIPITAQEGQGNSADKSAGPSGGKSGVSSSGSGGFPIQGWAGIGMGATTVVVVAAFAAGRKGHTND